MSAGSRIVIGIQADPVPRRHQCSGSAMTFAFFVNRMFARIVFFRGGNIWPVLAGALLLAIQSHAQYIGVTCGFNYDNDLTGPYTGRTNVPMFNPISGDPNATWDNWAEELRQSGVDFVCPNLRGSQPNTGVSPTNIAPFVTALDNQGNVTKLAIFDDNASSWTAQYNQALGYGYDYTVPFDISNTNNWRYIYDWNYELFYETVPGTNLFTIDGRPVIIIWSGSTAFITNMQGNASRAITYVRTRCQSDFGFNPFIILSGDFFYNDTTCQDAGIADAGQDWFTPTATPYTLDTANGAGIGVAVAEYSDAETSRFIDPDHGVTLETGLSNTVGAGALLTLCEGFTDWEEDAALFRVRNLDSNSNSLSYSETYYDYPNQRISILREFSQDPFPAVFKFEAEACDTYGGANGGSGLVNYYRNGNIAIQTTTDTGGGYNVGWITNGEWLQWQHVPLNGVPHFVMRVATPNSGCLAHFVIDGVAEPSQTLPTTGGWQTYTNVDFGSYGTYTQSYHAVEMVFDNGGENVNWWETLQTIPIFYTGCSFTGTSVLLGVGTYTMAQLQSAGLAADTLASVWVPNGFTVTLYSKDNFSGNSLTLTSNSSCLTAEDFQDATASITITAPLGPPAQLGILSPPSATAIAGVVLAAQPEVAVEDVYGNIISNATGTITVSETANGTINGTSPNVLSASIVSGIALFSGLFLTNAGADTLSFSDGSLTGIISGNITVNGTVAHRMIMQTEPSGGAEAGVAFATQPGVLMEDIYGNPVTNNTAVTVTAGSIFLLGATNAATVDGVATFVGLACTNLGNVTLTFNSGTLSTTSTVVNVTAGPATSVAWTIQPGQAGAGSPFGRQPVLQSVDAGGNPSTLQLGATNLVSISLLSGGQLLGGPLLVNIGTAGSNGMVAFHNLQINSVMTNVVLAASVIGTQLSPTNGIPNCILWLDASDYSTLKLNGDSVINWLDKSGTGNNATNTSGFPTLNTNGALSSTGYGRQRTLSFNGSNQKLYVNVSPLVGSPYTVMVVEIGILNQNNSYLFGSAYTSAAGTGGTDEVLHMGWRNTNYTFTTAQYADDLNYNAAAGTYFAYPVARVWTVTATNGTHTLYLDGAEVATTALASLPVGPLVGGAVGQGNGGWYHGDIAEFALYNRALTDTERASVESYLLNKWTASSEVLSAPFTVSPLIPSLSIMPPPGVGTNGNPAGGVTVDLVGSSGQTYRFQATTNLSSSWVDVDTNSAGSNGALQFIDVSATNYPHRFYRAVSP
jgi:hypothetical protein